MYKIPSHILFLDDQESFLKVLEKSFQHEILSPVFVQETNEAITYLGKKQLGFDPLNMGSHLSNAQRFEAVSIFVTDQEMPTMTGLAFLKELRTQLPHDQEFKKILLTGYVSDQSAIEAFNKGQIDSFIRKDNAHLMDALFAQINRFLEQIQHRYGKTPLDDVIGKLVEKHEIVECYPLDKSLMVTQDAGEDHDYDQPPYALGSHLLLKGTGEMIHVHVHTKETLESDLNFAKSQGAALDVLKALETQNKAFSHFNLYEPEPIPEPRDWVLGDVSNTCKSALKDLHRATDPKTQKDVFYTIAHYKKDDRTFSYEMVRKF